MANLSEATGLVNGAIVVDTRNPITAAKMRAVLGAIIDATRDELALKANLNSPALTGTPTVPLAPLADNTTKAASTSFVARAIATATTGVSMFNSRSGNVTLTSGDVTGALGYTPPNTNSPALTGVPTAPSAADGTSTTQLSTTAFVQTAISILKSTVSSDYDTLAKVETALGLKAPLGSPAFTGVPTVPTAAGGTNTTQAASTAFVQAALSGSVSGVSSFNTRTGAVSLTSGDVTGALTYTPANIASPAFTGTPTAPLAANGTNTSQIASTTFVQNAVILLKGGVSTTYDTLNKIATALLLKADIASPALTGTPTAPTAAGGTNTTQIATTAFVLANGASKLVSRAFASHTSNVNLSTVIPADDTIPQITEGTEVVTASITPATTTNRVRATFSCFVSGNATSNQAAIAALFQDSGTNALHAVAVTVFDGNNRYGIEVCAGANTVLDVGTLQKLEFTWEWVPATTSAITARVRVGPSVGTIRLNGSASSRLFGGVAAATLILEEITP